MDFFLVSFFRRSVPVDGEHPHSIVCLEYAVIGTRQVFFCTFVASEGDILHVEKSLRKLMSIIRQIKQQRLLAASSRMHECSEFTGTFVRARV